MTVTLLDPPSSIRTKEITIVDLFNNSDFRQAYEEYREDQAFDDAVQSPRIQSKLLQLAQML